MLNLKTHTDLRILWFYGFTRTQGDSGDATDDEMVSRKTRSCKEGLYRNGPESDSIDQEDPGDTFRNQGNLLNKSITTKYIISYNFLFSVL